MIQYSACPVVLLRRLASYRNLEQRMQASTASPYLLESRQARYGEFRKIRGTLLWGPYNTDPTISCTVLYWGPLFPETPRYEGASAALLLIEAHGSAEALNPKP